MGVLDAQPQLLYQLTPADQGLAIAAMLPEPPGSSLLPAAMAAAAAADTTTRRESPSALRSKRTAAVAAPQPPHESQAAGGFGALANAAGSSSYWGNSSFLEGMDMEGMEGMDISLIADCPKLLRTLQDLPPPVVQQVCCAPYTKSVMFCTAFYLSLNHTQCVLMEL
jgi:hypothetical protein